MSIIEARANLLAVINLMGLPWPRHVYDRIVTVAEERSRVSDWTVAELLDGAKRRLLQTGSVDTVIEALRIQ